MTYEVKCNRCGARVPMEFYTIDIGYWGHPAGWLRVDAHTHLCPDCKDKAVEPADAGQDTKEGCCNA